MPKILAIIPSFSREYRPINNPKKVNDAAQTLKISPAKNISLVIAIIPSPVEKLSKLTEMEIKNKFKILSSNILLSFLNKSITISIPIKIKIKPNNKLTLICKKVTILSPNRKPKRGIKKCIMPTKKHKKTTCLLVILKAPIERQIENVSIDRDKPIRNKEIIIDTNIT